MKDYVVAFNPKTGEIVKVWKGTRFRKVQPEIHQLQVTGMSEGHVRVRFRKFYQEMKGEEP